MTFCWLLEPGLRVGMLSQLLKQADVPGQQGITCRKYGVQASTIRKWRKQLDLLKDSHPHRCRAVGAGRRPLVDGVERELFGWIREKRLEEVLVPRKLVQVLLNTLYLFHGLAD